MYGVVEELLDHKQGQLLVVAPDVPIATAIDKMNEFKVGSVLVLQGQALLGIFTERDVLTRVVVPGKAPTVLVSEVMTPRPCTVRRKTPIAEAMKTMSTCRFRHLPVVESERVLGIISAGDIMRHALQELEHEVESLQTYIQTGGVVPA